MRTQGHEEQRRRSTNEEVGLVGSIPKQEGMLMQLWRWRKQYRESDPIGTRSKSSEVVVTGHTLPTGKGKIHWTG